MFAVIFEVHPIAVRWDDYLGHAGLLRPELERIDGFVDNMRYRSLGRSGWLLSLSTWRDEKALIRWRTHVLHHHVQMVARQEIFHDYHLRVGEIFADSASGAEKIEALRRDETEVGVGRVISVMQGPVGDGPGEVDGFQAVERDMFEAILTPGDGAWLVTSRDAMALPPMAASPGMRRRDIRIIRDYGMFDRREAPQFFPEAAPVTPPG